MRRSLVNCAAPLFRHVCVKLGIDVGTSDSAAAAYVEKVALNERDHHRVAATFPQSRLVHGDSSIGVVQGLAWAAAQLARPAAD